MLLRTVYSYSGYSTEHKKRELGSACVFLAALGDSGKSKVPKAAKKKVKGDKPAHAPADSIALAKKKTHDRMTMQVMEDEVVPLNDEPGAQPIVAKKARSKSRARKTNSRATSAAPSESVDDGEVDGRSRSRAPPKSTRGRPRTISRPAPPIPDRDDMTIDEPKVKTKAGTRGRKT